MQSVILLFLLLVVGVVSKTWNCVDHFEGYFCALTCRMPHREGWRDGGMEGPKGTARISRVPLEYGVWRPLPRCIIRLTSLSAPSKLTVDTVPFMAVVNFSFP